MELLSPYAPVINNSGGIAFYCDFGPSRVGLCTPSAILARSDSIIGGHTLTLFGFPAINNSGRGRSGELKVEPRRPFSTA